MKVKDLMRHKPKTVTLSTSLDIVWNILGVEQMHILPVVDDNKTIKGIITAEDLLMNLVPNYREFFSDFFATSPTMDDIVDKLKSQKRLVASDVMNTTVYTVYSDHDVFKALARLLAYNIRILPVVNRREKLVGFIVEKDIIKYLFKKQQSIAKKLSRSKKSI